MYVYNVYVYMYILTPSRAGRVFRLSPAGLPSGPPLDHIWLGTGAKPWSGLAGGRPSTGLLAARSLHTFLTSPKVGIMVQGSGFRVQGSGFRVQGSGFSSRPRAFRAGSNRHFQST